MRSRQRARVQARREARSSSRAARGTSGPGNAAALEWMDEEAELQGDGLEWAVGAEASLETGFEEAGTGETARRRGGRSTRNAWTRGGGDGFFGRRRRRRGPAPAPRPRTVEPPAPRVQPAPMETPSPAVAPAGPVVLPDSVKMPTGRELIEGWEQTSKGNCVTVAAIKAAQMTFGPQLVNDEDSSLGVFSECTPLPDGGMHIVMRDGFELTVSESELRAAALSSRFRTDKGRDDLLENANQLYAVAAKRAQIEGNDGFQPGQMSYARSLQALEDGEITANVMEQVGRLGLKDHAHKAPRSELKNHKATLSSGEGHAYFVSEGQRDYYGRVGPLGPAGYQSSARDRRRSRSRKAPHSNYGTVLNREKVRT